MSDLVTTGCDAGLGEDGMQLIIMNLLHDLGRLVDLTFIILNQIFSVDIRCSFVLLTLE